MGIETVVKFIDTATVQVWVYVYTQADVLVDPTGVTVDIYDPDGTQQVDGAAMTKSETGIYYYNYHAGATAAAMAKGKWRGVVTITDGSGATAIITPIPFAFEVI
jgi:hypothetical protein